MKTCIYLVTLSLVLAFVNAFSTEEQVKRFFCPEHKALLPETTSLEFRDEPALLTSSQNDESTKCLAHCEPSCERLDVPASLTVEGSFHKFEDTPINCVLGSTVVFKKTPRYRCKFLALYQFDCCRACNAVNAKCMKSVGSYSGGPEFCYRNAYKCMCKCLEKHTPLENYYP